MLKELMKCIREYKKPSILAPVLVSLEVVMECTIPFLIAMLVNQIKAGAEFSVLVKYGLLLIVMATLSLMFGIGAGNACATASCGFAKNVRKDLYAKLSLRSRRYFLCVAQEGKSRNLYKSKLGSFRIAGNFSVC